MAITEEDIGQIEEAFNRTLQNRDRLDAATHHYHHRWIEQSIKEEIKVAERKEKIIQAVGGWGAISLISGVIIAVYHYLKARF